MVAEDATTKGPARPSNENTNNTVGGNVAGNVIQAGIVNISAREKVGTPRQLPADIADFSGRHEDLSKLSLLLAEPDGEIADLKAVVISAISGTAGIGKTALAVHWAHHNQNRFPDGELYVNLRGYDSGTPMLPSEALADFLRSLGVPPEQVPPSLESRATLYRSLVHGKTMLVILDNANSADQVRPLLPGGQATFVIITSRSRLSGLVSRDSARRISLDALTDSEAVELLRKVSSSTLSTASDATLVKIASLCDYLPLALRIAGERLREGGPDALVSLLSELSDSRRRLDALQTDDEDELTALRTVLQWSYGRLDTGTARAFSLLGLFPGVEFGAHAVAAICDIPLREARRNLSRLVDNHLLTPTDSGLFRFHDLIRCLATEKANDLADGDCRDALVRLHMMYLYAAEEADKKVAPQRRQGQLAATRHEWIPRFTDREAALAWCDRERENFVRAAASAEQSADYRTAWLIPITLWGYFHLTKRWDEWNASHIVALRCVRKLGDRMGEGRVLNSLGNVYHETHRLVEAAKHYLMALALRRETDDLWGEAFTLNNLGECYLELGDYVSAEAVLSEGLEISRDLDYHWGTVSILRNYGRALLGASLLEAAREKMEQSISLATKVGYEWGEGLSLHALADVLLVSGSLMHAYEACNSAITILHRVDFKWGVAAAQRTMAAIQKGRGEYSAARQALLEALELERATKAHSGEAATHAALADLYEFGKDSVRARYHWQIAIDISSLYDKQKSDAYSVRLLQLDMMIPAANDKE